MSDELRKADLTGRRFGRLIVLGRASNRSGHRQWDCRCDCGRLKQIRGMHLLNSRSQSCGCYSAELAKVRETTHGEARGTRSREYRAWRAAKARCFNTKHRRYKDWGGRGVTMCERWRDSFQAFLEDMGRCPPGMVLDRQENDDDYKPGNCRWTTPIVSNQNRRRPQWSKEMRLRAAATAKRQWKK